MVFDRYENPQSIKVLERQRRGATDGRPTHVITGNTNVPNYRKYLTSSGNKTALCIFVSNYIITAGPQRIQSDDYRQVDMTKVRRWRAYAKQESALWHHCTVIMRRLTQQWCYIPYILRIHILASLWGVTIPMRKYCWFIMRAKECSSLVYMDAGHEREICPQQHLIRETGKRHVQLSTSVSCTHWLWHNKQFVKNRKDYSIHQTQDPSQRAQRTGPFWTLCMLGRVFASSKILCASALQKKNKNIMDECALTWMNWGI